ncbi:MAG: hypothetical protein QM534_08920 [Sediminibacterium sp.]|nr:hypothetical protein [Sediminibacterium sp.]
MRRKLITPSSSVLATMTIMILSSCFNYKKEVKKIQDCPDQVIINKMPGTDVVKSSDLYYIYKGKRAETKDFDTAWITNNCKSLDTIIVY